MSTQKGNGDVHVCIHSLKGDLASGTRRADRVRKAGQSAGGLSVADVGPIAIHTCKLNKIHGPGKLRPSVLKTGLFLRGATANHSVHASEAREGTDAARLRHYPVLTRDTRSYQQRDKLDQCRYQHVIHVCRQ